MGATYAAVEGGRYRVLKSMLPDGVVMALLRVRSYMRLASNFWYDANRYARASALGAVPANATQFEALVTMNYHRIEKGLTLPQPRPFFGEVPIKELLTLIERHSGTYAHSNATKVAINALQEYVQWHRQQQLHSEFVQSVENRLSALRLRLQASASQVSEGGTESLTTHPPALPSATRQAIFLHRRSVRDFSDADVDPSLIEEAVALALHTPSVCNRQAWRVRCIQGRERIDHALRFQNGNRGFGHTITSLLVVTSTMGSFVSSGERNQGWVDGGMFSMALITALHTQGLASCPLNWSADAHVDRSFRKAFGVPEDEIVMMFIGVGHYKPDYRVCQSPRVPLQSVLTFE